MSQGQRKGPETEGPNSEISARLRLVLRQRARNRRFRSGFWTFSKSWTKRKARRPREASGKRTPMQEAETAGSQSSSVNACGAAQPARLCDFADRRRRDRADDLVQDTLMKAWAKQDSLRARHQHEGLAVHDPAQRVLFSQMRKNGREVEDADGILTERMAVPPGAVRPRSTCRISRRRWTSCRTTSAKPSSWSARPAFPTRRPPKSAAAPSAPSRAASAGPVMPFRKHCRWTRRTITGRTRHRSPQPPRLSSGE